MKGIPMTVNGKNIPLKEPISLKAYLESINLNILAIAVGKNGVIVPRNLFADDILNDGDTLEIVNFVGGG
jgi:thiamine biosynthesis protein ThiS